MPFVNYPLQCTCCRGIGSIKPVSAFEVNRQVMMTECPVCQGKGTIENKVYVNPPKESCKGKETNTKIESNLNSEEIIHNEEFEKAFDSAKKIKLKKSEIKDAVR